MTATAYAPDFQVAWSSSAQEDARFKKILLHMLAVLLIVAVAMPWLPVPEITREEQEEIPPQLARIILEKQALIKPVPKPKPKPKVAVKPEKKAIPKPKPKAKPKPKPVDFAAEARKKAAISGVLAFQDDLAQMRESINVDGLTKSNLSRGRATAEKLERSVITGKVTKGSGGIQTASLSQDTGGVALSGRETTRIESPIGGGRAGTSARAGNKGKVGGRSDEMIRRVMDANKGAVFSVYNRALRKDPTLEGKFVFEMVIEPNGAVSKVKLLSSELKDETLKRKILARIRLIQFGAASVLRTRVNYSFDFLPY